MFGFLPGPVLGVLSFFVLAINTLFWSFALFLVAVLKLAIPVNGWRLFCSKLSNRIAQSWVAVNSRGLEITKDLQWDIEGIDDRLTPRAWYLLLANHQSMVDITVLQKIFLHKTPPLKFFLKQELIWVPVLGAAWWALDFPFMRRSSSARRDLETTRKACEKFKLIPVTIMNFVEGTRFTKAKREEQSSPYEHLLKPKTGGIAIVLGSMGEQLQSILDVTIVYPGGVPGMWEFLCSKTSKIIVKVKQLPMSTDMIGDYFTDRAFRKRFNDWLNTLWTEKDAMIGRLLEEAASKQS